MRSKAHLGALAGGLLAPAASAGIIHFANPESDQPGHYDWRWEAEERWQSWLDITRSPQQQTNAPNQNSIAQMFHPWGNAHDEDADAPGQHAQIMALFGIVPNTSPLLFGEPIVEDFERGFHDGSLHAPSGGGPPFVEGKHAYIGVRTGNGNYGWIEVVRTGTSLTAFAWAYETEPDVPILAGQVPAPGAAALMGVGMLAVASRRRRS